MKKYILRIAETEYMLFILFGIFILLAHSLNLSSGKIIQNNFWLFFTEMIAFLPFMFILVGLFDVWFPKEKVEKHIGKDSGIKGTFWVILLAMLQAGPLYGAFPVAYMLWKKGASIKNIFIYLGAFSTLKIPMLTFEIGFLGLKFSLLRTLVTLPVFILIGKIMEIYLRDKYFEIRQPDLFRKDKK
ncbi:MAG: hypothetical protein COS68_06645 [Elusimicrobia bacterium CG06_land_8_20_14_3_00_38_11]|nr:MAG: hypothetical protein COS68_06645 [Elusimicrobia bacterium CG06_land_8_20_14_3_00_38_11]